MITDWRDPKKRQRRAFGCCDRGRRFARLLRWRRETAAQSLWILRRGHASPPARRRSRETAAQSLGYCDFRAAMRLKVREMAAQSLGSCDGDAFRELPDDRVEKRQRRALDPATPATARPHRSESHEKRQRRAFGYCDAPTSASRSTAALEKRQRRAFGYCDWVMRPRRRAGAAEKRQRRACGYCDWITWSPDRRDGAAEKRQRRALDTATIRASRSTRPTPTRNGSAEPWILRRAARGAWCPCATQETAAQSLGYCDRDSRGSCCSSIPEKWQRRARMLKWR
jgi:hypothetical protein